MEQLNIEGKRSGEGFVAHRGTLVGALARAQSVVIELCNFMLGRRGLINYLRLMGGSEIVKIVPSTNSGQRPSNGSAEASVESAETLAEVGSASPSGEGQAAVKRLKVVCGANIGYLEDGAWLTEKTRFESPCQIRVSPHNGVSPNLGGVELAEALARVILFAFKGGKDDNRPVLESIRLAHKEGKLTLAGQMVIALPKSRFPLRMEKGKPLLRLKT